MKRITALASLALALIFAGCGRAPNTPTPPLAPASGYSNQADQVMGETLATAHAFYQTLQQNALPGMNGAAPKFTPSPTEKTALNSFGLALNTAQMVYLAYHSGQATQAQAQAQVNAVKAEQTSLEATLGAGVK